MRSTVFLLAIAGCVAAALGACSAGIVEVQQAAYGRDCGLLAAQLSRKEPWILEEAVAGLGTAGCTQATDALMELLSDGDRDERVRAAAGVALARLRKVEAVPLLVGELARSSHPELRYALVSSLGTLCTPESVGALEGAVSDGDIYVSRAARKGLARCAGELSAGGTP